MLDRFERFESPFSSRYASDEMQYLFSPAMKFKTWRRLWIALAKAERAEGLDISQAQIDEMERFADDINYDVAAAHERLVRHDVMSHVYAFGTQCPAAKGIIHLGATSCYVGDNTDLIVMRSALGLLRKKLINVIALLSDFAEKYKNLPALAYTHLQPAQLTTVGKRACLWIHELMMDLEEAERRIAGMKFLGSKGTTGTQASFVELFDGDDDKIKNVEQRIAEEMGFAQTVPVSGQTYSRKVDAQILDVLSGIAQTAGKFANDMRLLQSFKEMEEPFEKEQIGSSAMPYKRNPMRSERICALSRFVITAALNPALTASVQWFERTLDDSANRRIAVSEAFLGADAMMELMLNVCDGLVVYPKVIARRVARELPFMATENIMMRAVKKGGDRQQLHEKLRAHSMAAAAVVKEEGGENDLIARIAGDESFNLSEKELDGLMDAGLYVGRAPKQVDEYLNGVIRPMLVQNALILGQKGLVRV
jgi:adenylosuccinate lyase